MVGREIRKLRQSFACAFRGIRLCMKSERNFRIHLTAAAYVSLFAALGGLDGGQCALLALCFGVMMGAELMNTAIEELCDWKAEGYDRTVRDAKDIAAAAVLVCALACVAVAAFYFLRPAVLGAIGAALWNALWLVGLLVLSIPAACWFIFCFGRK